MTPRKQAEVQRLQDLAVSCTRQSERATAVQELISLYELALNKLRKEIEEIHHSLV